MDWNLRRFNRRMQHCTSDYATPITIFQRSPPEDRSQNFQRGWKGNLFVSVTGAGWNLVNFADKEPSSHERNFPLMLRAGSYSWKLAQSSWILCKSRVTCHALDPRGKRNVSPSPYTRRASKSSKKYFIVYTGRPVPTITWNISCFRFRCYRLTERFSILVESAAFKSADSEFVSQLFRSLKYSLELSKLFRRAVYYIFRRYFIVAVSMVNKWVSNFHSSRY